MVMYRDFVCRRGRALGLVGYVKNLSDGMVEVVAQGEKSALEKFVAKLRNGSLLSRVDKIEIEWRQPVAPLEGFIIRY